MTLGIVGGFFTSARRAGLVQQGGEWLFKVWACFVF